MRREDPPDRIQGRKAPFEVVRKTSNGALFIPAKNLPNGNEHIIRALCWKTGGFGEET